MKMFNHSFRFRYVVYKEKMKGLISSKYSSNLMFFSDFSTPICPIPYFSQELTPFDSNGLHLIICVHGLDGNSGDLRLIKTYLELCLPSCRLDFLMSSSNSSSTFDDIDIMVKQLIDEIDIYIERYGLKPQRISFIGHSLGNLIVRATVSHQRFEKYRKSLYTYLSLSGPHLGTLFNNSGLVNMGLFESDSKNI
jgi:pimeloyl-ACP methyl ester carboxylesterase